jgi:hypothetical protein
MRALLVLLGALALPACVFFTLVIDVPLVGFVIAPAAVPVLYALIVALVSVRAAVAAFLVGFGLANLVATLAIYSMFGDVFSSVSRGAS